MVIYMKNLFLIAAFALLMLSGCSKEGYDSGIKEGYGAVSIGVVNLLKPRQRVLRLLIST